MTREALFALLSQELKQIQDLLYTQSPSGHKAVFSDIERVKSLFDQERFIILTMERLLAGVPPPPESAPKSAWDKLRDPV
jgi:hypothetical protein